MAAGVKTGGRKAGTRNRDTKAVIELLKARKYCAVNELVDLAENAAAEGDTQTRLHCAQILIKYSHPMLRAVEHTSTGGGPLQLIINTGVPTDPPTESAEMPSDIAELMAKARRQLDG